MGIASSLRLFGKAPASYLFNGFRRQMKNPLMKKGVVYAGVSGTCAAAGYMFGNFVMEKHIYQVKYTEEQEKEVLEVENRLQNLKIVKDLRQNPSFRELRMPFNRSNHSLTNNLLSGPGRITVPPVIFYDKSTRQVYAIAHVGKDVGLDDDTIHPGLIAT